MILASRVHLNLVFHMILVSRVHLNLVFHMISASLVHLNLASHIKLTSHVHFDLASHMKLDYLADFDLVSHEMVFLDHLDFDFVYCSVFDLVCWPVESQIFVYRPSVCLALDVAGSNPPNSFLDLNPGTGVQP